MYFVVKNFFTNNYLNFDNLISITHIPVKLSELIIDMLMEGTVSQYFKFMS